MSPPKPKPLVTPGGPIATAAVGALVGLLRALPRRFREALFRGLGRLVFALGVRRRVALDNLAHAFPEKTEPERRAIAREAYQTMALAALEAVTSDQVPNAELERAVEVLDWKGLDARLFGGLPTVVASAHFGSWELFAEVMARRGARFSAVVRPLSGAFNAKVVQLRQRAGVGLILQRGALRGMLAALGRGETVVQLVDQSVPARQGVFVPFLGRPASTSPAAAAAAIRSDAPVYVVLAARDGGRLTMMVEGPLHAPTQGEFREQVAALTATIAQVLERGIRARPGQWLWLHRRWKERPL